MHIRFFGQFLLSQGIITAPQLVAALEHQEEHNIRLGEHAVALGYLTEAQADRVNARQATKDIQFGEAAIDMGLLTQEQVDALLTEQRSHHVMLGEALEALGFVTGEQIEDALAEFMREQAKYAELAIAVPPEFPMRGIASRLLDLAGKQMFRLWGVRNKPGAMELQQGTITLSDRNAEVKISGQFSTSFLLAVPEAVARRAVERVTGATEATPEELDDVVRELANVICGNLVALLAAEGKAADIEPPETVSARHDLEGGKALVMSFLTLEGQAFVALTF